MTLPLGIPQEKILTYIPLVGDVELLHVLDGIHRRMLHHVIRDTLLIQILDDLLFVHFILPFMTLLQGFVIHFSQLGMGEFG